MLDEHLKLAERFHLDITKLPMAATPRLLGKDELVYADMVFSEEIEELRAATTVGDQADAIIDLIYFAYGRLLEMGVKPGPAFRLVHDANMQKVSGANKRGDRFEAAKPDGWRAPDWDTLLGTRGKYLGLKPKKKVLLLGYGRHGKDTVADILKDRYGYKFTSSSLACAEHVMMPAFQCLRAEWWAACEMVGATSEKATGVVRPPMYESAAECFEDRHNHRKFWFDEIERYNSPDKSKLGQLIFSQNDIYVGLRSKREFSAVKMARLYDVCVWVDRSDHAPPEIGSCTVEPWMADYVLDNNGTLDDLQFNVQKLVEQVL